MNRVNRHFPPHVKKSKSFNELAHVETIELDKLDLQIEDLNKQIIIETATWGLDIWERELGLPINPDKTLAERRSIILAKLRGIGKVDNIMIKAIVEAYTNNKVTIEFDGRIKIIFTNNEKIHFNRDMKTAIDEVKPAHLGYDYIVKQIIELTFNLKTYTFGVPYKICNMFQTDDIFGGLMKVVLGLDVESYTFDVLYPICNTFITSQIVTENVKNNVILANEYRDNEVLFKRVGSTNVGEGDI